MTIQTFDFAIIGAGIVGAATARALRQRYPDKSIVVIDKESGPSLHQSGHNSGVIHAGVYYEPKSFKAQLCREGLTETLAFCRAEGIAAQQPGKLIVAADKLEHDRLRTLAKRAVQNGVACREVTSEELAELEPHVVGEGALMVTETGITDYPAITRALLMTKPGEAINTRFHARVTGIEERPDAVTIVASDQEFAVQKLVVCGGLQADRLARMAGLRPDCEIIPFRGDFYRLSARFNSMFSHLIYPVPNPELPFLGVHITKLIDGGVSVGPSAMLAFAREAYKKTGFSWRDASDMARWPGLWRLLAKYPVAGAREASLAISRKQYARAVRRYCPSVSVSDLVTHQCGIRAQAVNRAGDLVHDFWFEQTRRMLHVLNAPSPAATAAIPIGRLVAEKLAE